MDNILSYKVGVFLFEGQVGRALSDDELLMDVGWSWDEMVGAAWFPTCLDCAPNIGTADGATFLDSTTRGIVGSPDCIQLSYCDTVIAFADSSQLFPGR